MAHTYCAYSYSSEKNDINTFLPVILCKFAEEFINDIDTNQNNILTKKYMMKKHSVLAAAMAIAGWLSTPSVSYAQSKLYDQHFDLSEVRLGESPFATAMYRNARLLLDYDADRLMTPFIRQAGLDKAGSKYQGWTTTHPSFPNWGLDSWSLEGHVGGHYLTALAMAYSAISDENLRGQLKDRLDYCITILNDCQEAFDDNSNGLKGFIGGQPINQIWTGLYANDLTEFRKYGGWVPFYCEHKVLAGLRDAWIYAGNEMARECFRKLCQWSADVVSKLSYSDMQNVLGWEHGGMNEVLADAYHIFGDSKWLEVAQKYCHAYEVNGMQGTSQSYSRTFLDGQHANTQVPKFIGFERIAALTTGDNARLATAARNFWSDVADNRTVCIGGNSVSEHFLAHSKGEQYVTNLDGPESCNSNNMLKLSEMLFDRTHDARYADFYEQTMWNHILSTQDPETGGYVYFTSLRPQSYRIYSQVNQGMWCCVGTGMENHSKYAHFIYTHQGDSVIYVNLYTASELQNDKFGLKQQTEFPYSQQSTITINKAGTYTVALRHPSWATEGFSVEVNGIQQDAEVTAGVASYVRVSRSWQAGDVISVKLPMTMRIEPCPDYPDYIAFKYGPVLLAAKTTAATEEEAAATGLEYEKLQNEYGGEGRMDHAPGSMATMKSLSSAPLLIGERADVLNRIKTIDAGKLTFAIDCTREGNSTFEGPQGTKSWLTLQPFHTIHHSRYSCYWYQQTEENYANSDMGQKDAEEEAINSRTIDFVATGEQQSEAGHDALYSTGSTSGNYNGETYRDARAGEFIQYTLANPSGRTDSMAVMCRFTVADKGRSATVYIDGQSIGTITIPETIKGSDDKGFFNIEFPIPAEVMTDAEGNGKTSITFKIVASQATLCPGLYYLRLVSGYDAHDYVFRARDWQSGDEARVRQANITYDDINNTITLKAGTGANNVCLGLNHANTDYTLTPARKYLVVRGTNLSLLAGKSYLWWLNGINKGTSVAPTRTATVTISNGETKTYKQVIAWDMTASGLDANNTGQRFSICNGMTIFGLTSTTGTSTIDYIGFESSIDDFITSTAVTLQTITPQVSSPAYTLSGIRKNGNYKGVYIKNGKKQVKNLRP